MRCPTCGHENREGAKFCDECGQRFHSPQPSAASLVEQTITVFTPEPERKIITALFSDLTGYTALTERLEPEQVKEITGQVFAGVKQIITNYEGFIDRLLGDGVLAFFGIPKAHEDDPVRALQATLEIHEFVKGLSPRYEGRIGAPLSMHSGINTGLVVTAEVDPEKGSQGVAGDAVNLAARLSGLAGPGEILVGEKTVRRTRGRFEFQDLGAKRVKGKAEPVAMFKLTSVKAQSPNLDLRRRHGNCRLRQAGPDHPVDPSGRGRGDPALRGHPHGDETEGEIRRTGPGDRGGGPGEADLQKYPRAADQGQRTDPDRDRHGRPPLG
jgi:class 3 adenylate cyclase